MMWCHRCDNHLYVFWNGQLIWKRWLGGKVSALMDLHSRNWFLEEDS
jgi:hypothetical protein